MGDADVTISGVWRFESITPSQDMSDNAPNSPATGEAKTVNWFFALWVISLLGILILLPLLRKNHQ